MFVLPGIEWSRRRTTAEYRDPRDAILAQRSLVENYTEPLQTIGDALAKRLDLMQAVTEQVPLFGIT